VTLPPFSGARPTERQIALFSAVEDLHDLTAALVVLLVDRHGTSIAVSGDEDEIPAPLRSAISGRRLAEAGSVRELLMDVDMGAPRTRGEGNAGTLNVSIYSATDDHVLAIVFDADADLATVQTVGREGAAMISEILSAPL
jgi:hypothetical protein